MTPCPHVTDPDLLDWLEENPALMEAHCWWAVQHEWAALPWSAAEKVVDKF